MNSKSIFLKLILLFLFYSILLTDCIFAQSEKKIFTSIFTQNTMNRRTFKIIKDTDGFMWFTTAEGVCRYDGMHIKNYRIERIESLQRSFIIRNETGFIYYISARGNVYQYNKMTDSFDKTFTIPSDMEYFIQSALLDGENIMWLATRNGLYSFNINDSKLIKHSELSDANNPITTLLVYSDNVWLLSKRSIIKIKTNARNRFKPYSIIEKIAINMKSAIVSAYYDEYSQTLFLGAFKEGVFALDKYNKLINILPQKNVPITKIIPYDSQTILIGMDGGGMYQIDRNDFSVEAKYTMQEDEPGSLNANGIQDIFVDDQKRIWIATYTDGINIYDPMAINFNSLSHYYKTTNSLYNNHVNAILKDDAGNVWFGTNFGISVLINRTKQWKHFFTDDTILLHNRVIMTLCQDDQGTIWAGGFGTGLIKIKNFIPEIILTKNKGTGLSTNFIYSLYKDSDNKIWIGGVMGEFESFDPLTQIFVKYGNIRNVMSITEKRKDTMILLQSGKLMLLNTRNRKIESEIDTLISGHKLHSEDPIQCFRKAGDHLWIGTQSSGLIIYSLADKSIKTYNKNNGLQAESVKAIEIDQRGCGWVSTEMGLFYINSQTDDVIHIRSIYKLERNLFNIRASYTAGEQMFFGMSTGCLQFDARHLPLDSVADKPLISDLKINNRSIYDFKDGPRLKKPLNETDRISLSYQENTIELNISQINYNVNQRRQFRWILEGYDSQWSLPFESGKVIYQNLAPGVYTFKVCNAWTDKTRADNQRSITIKIGQPWWNTFYAWVAYILLISTFIYFIFKLYKERIAIQGSKEKIQFFINVAHDIRTPISLIKGPLITIEQDDSLSESVRYLIGIANKNVNRLHSMINIILDFEKSGTKNEMINLSQLSLNDYIYGLSENFYPYALSNSISIEVVDAPKNIRVAVDKDKMDKILDNLMSNAIKYSTNSAGSVVRIVGGYDDEKWWIEVQDNGIGISKKDQAKLFHHFYRAENAINSKQIGSGLGLMLTYNLVKLMNGTITFSSAENEYTHFRVTFPLIEFANIEQPAAQTENILPTDINRTVSDKEVILIVDDNNEILEYLDYIFSTEYSVVKATNANDALHYLSCNSVTIVLSDIMMPQVNGIELCLKIKSETKMSQIPVVLVSALEDKRDILKGLQAGADDYVTKPFDPILLKQRIRNIIDSRKKLIELFANPKSGEEVDPQDFYNQLDTKFMTKINDVIAQNIGNNQLSIDLLCKEIGVSRSVLFNRLKNLINETPNNYIKEKRLKYAYDLLKTESYTIIEVAEMSGFTDSNYFSTSFKKRFGYPPSKMGKQ